MEKIFTYQQDTVKAANPLKNLSGFPESGGLKIERRTAPAPLIPESTRDTVEPQPDTVETQTQPAPPTNAQIRYWWWQREKNLLVGESRFMQPRNDVQLVLPQVNENQGLRLPARQVNRVNSDWLTLLLLLTLVLLASVRSAWDKYLGHLFHSVVNYSTSFRMFQEKNSSVLQGAFRLDILFYLVFSVFMFQLVNYLRISFDFRSLHLFLFSLGGVLAYFLLKKMIYWSIGILVEKTSETGEYLFNMDNFNRVAGLVLVPVVAVIAFWPFSDITIPVATGIFMVSALYLLLLLRGFVILLKKQFSIFYLFLYFCTLEFLPLVLLYKIFVV